jgi:aldehyde dehydrogenase (NAD+)
VSVQRVLAHSSLVEALTERVVAQVEALTTGRPDDPATDVGPLVDEAAAARVQEWVDEAVAHGATLLTGGTRQGATVAPTVLSDAHHEAKVVCEEVFGPVMVIEAFDAIDEAFDIVNAGRFGLQTGLFTRDLPLAFRAHRDLEVGGVVIGDVPSYRADQMPYGGTKDSGVGREGLRYAMEDFTYERVLVLSGLDL